MEEIEPLRAVILCLDFIEKRLEMFENINETQTEKIKEYALEYKSEIERCLEMVNRTKEVGGNLTEAVERLVEATSSHMKKLVELKERFGEEVREEIEEAINASARKQEEALNCLREISEEMAEEMEEKIPSEIEEIKREMGIMEELRGMSITGMLSRPYPV